MQCFSFDLNVVASPPCRVSNWNPPPATAGHLLKARWRLCLNQVWNDFVEMFDCVPVALFQFTTSSPSAWRPTTVWSEWVPQLSHCHSLSFSLCFCPSLGRLQFWVKGKITTLCWRSRFRLIHNMNTTWKWTCWCKTEHFWLLKGLIWWYDFWIGEP